MPIERIHDPLSLTLIRRLGDAGGPRTDQVSEEFDQIVDLVSGVSTDEDVYLKYNHATDPVLRVDQLGAGLIQLWENNGADRASLSALGRWLLPAGIGTTPSTDQISNFGTYFIDPVPRNTPASTAETDLSSKTLSANVMFADGDFILGFAAFLTATNANTKRYRLYFGGTVFYDTGAAAFNAVSHVVPFVIMKINANTVVTFTFGQYSGTTFLAGGLGASAVQRTIITPLTFSGTLILKSTGQNGTATANDLRQDFFIALKGSV